MWLDASSENTGTKLLVTGGGLNADGNGTGNGGEIKLINGQSAFMLGLNGDASSVSAASGTQGGNGGTVYVQSGGDLNVDMNHVDLSARGENGDGGSLYLIAGMRGNPFEFFSQTTAYDEGSLSVQGAVKVDGVGTGNGGAVYIQAGKSSLTIGGAESNVSLFLPILAKTEATAAILQYSQAEI